MTARLGLTIGPTKQLSSDSLFALVKLADDLGYHSVWIPEVWGEDAVSLLAVMARETSHILLASGIFNVFSRSAALIAQTAASLQHISRGRFILGIGTSGPRVVEQWHGVPFDTPLARTREYIAVIRTALSGSVVDFKGKIIDVAGFTLGNVPPSSVPIYVASIGPRNVYLTGELADGWLPIFAARDGMRSLFSALRSGASAAGRDASLIDVAAYLPAIVSPRGERLLRQQVAYYLGGMGSFYSDLITRLGFADDVDSVRTLWAAGDRTLACAAISDKLLNACTLGTEPHTAFSRLRAYRSDGIRLPILAFPYGADADEIRRTLIALAPQ